MNAIRSFLPSEIVLAAGLAVIVEGGLFILLATASNKAHVTAIPEADKEATPIEVKPVLDDAPLLKLGSKKKAKLPDMWVKKPPVVRQQAVAAPSPKADPTPQKIPDTPLPKPSAEPPPPDTDLAKQVDPQAKPDDSAKPVPEQALPTEGAADGVKEGTEADPLKAFAVGQYRLKISGWFNARFKKPTSEIPCDVLKKLRASVTASVGGERTVTGYSLVKPSGNEIFDARVKATLDGIVSSGAELPPPPPNYEDVLGTSISVAFYVPSCN